MNDRVACRSSTSGRTTRRGAPGCSRARLGGKPDVLLQATGSAVALCIGAGQRLGREGVRARVVSLPSWDLFKSQFGNSAPVKVAEAHFGFDVAQVVAAAKKRFARHAPSCMGSGDMTPSLSRPPSGCHAVHPDLSLNFQMNRWLSLVRDAGYDVVAFEGPGQGGALFDAGLPMTHEWEKPVAAMLEHFGINDMSLIGLSMGGYFAMRAAVFEPRVQRTVAYDVFFGAFDCNLRLMPAASRRLLPVLLRLKLDGLVNVLARRAAKRSLVIEWGLMLLAGSEDRYVPLAQFHKQIAALTNTRSLTARLFTRAESAQNPCQAGNFGLALQVITARLDPQAARPQRG